MTSEWGRIARERGSVFRHMPGRDRTAFPCTSWERVGIDYLRDTVLKVLGKGLGIPEVTLDLSDDLRILTPSLEVLNEHLPDSMDAETCYVRTALSAGREFYALFLSGETIRYLGSIEMIEQPPSRWMTGDPVPFAGEGEAFCAPAMTLHFATERTLMVRTFKDLQDREKGLFAYRWLVEESIGETRIDRLPRGTTPYASALSAIIGTDLISMDKRPDDIATTGLVPIDRLRGFFMGTLPGRNDEGQLVGARSVELSLSMFMGLGMTRSLERIRALSKRVLDDKALFSLLDGSEMDPFFLQKIFKINKAHFRLEEHDLDPLFPDTVAVNIISSSRRRGMTASEICDLTGLKNAELRDLEDRFSIKPSLQRGIDIEGGSPSPLVLSWPEASVVLVEGSDRIAPEPLKGRVLVTTRMSGAFSPDADRILFADPEEGIVKSLRSSFPDADFLRETGNN